MKNNDEIEEFVEFIYSKLPSKMDSIGKRFSILNMVITDNYPNSDPLSYCGFGVWYDRKKKQYYGN